MLNDQQIKVLKRLLDTAGEAFEQGINARKHQSLAKVSKATVTRVFAELLEKAAFPSYLAVGAARVIRCCLVEQLPTNCSQLKGSVLVIIS